MQLRMLLAVAAMTAVKECTASEERILYGLKPDFRARIAFASSLTCDSGTKTIPVSSVNDDYCDCRDGTDEPGTAACSHTGVQFHCENVGYFSSDVPTSRVNDGLCDCCDGSDEYKSSSTCPNTCATLRAAYDLQEQAEEAVRAAGRNARADVVAASKLKKEEHFRKRTDLEVEKAAADTAVTAARATKAAEEALEVQAQKEAARATRKKVASHLGLLDMSSTQLVDLVWLNVFPVLDLTDKIYVKTDILDILRGIQPSDQSVIEQQEQAYLLTEEAYRNEVTRITDLNADLAKAKEAAKEAAQVPTGDGDEPAPVEIDESKYEPVPLPTKPDRPIVTLFAELTANQATNSRPEAVAARQALAAAESKATQVDSELTSLDATLRGSYGPDDVLYSLRDSCVDTTSGQYTYKMCYFGQANQDQTSLGTMQPIELPLTALKFTGGAKCWNGPERSFHVTLVCGDTTALTNVEEPSTCVYSATLTTPIVCGEASSSSPKATHDEL
ncbi:hypothetical protein B5M09_004886 [Aphanomyces astaci]|uniref:Glucosidase 2 subunit beta n=1 Tax=Aphanomyces astaci TaxID=112090 RepID=A0A3R7YJW7_APHAT|nr:hypothetical protein B5M09_004886 [Aphanomyces astaci]